MRYEHTRSFAEAQDANDPLASFRDSFHIPRHEGEEVRYFCGNSLGLQPKAVVEELNIELKSWKNNGVEGHFKGERPWMHYSQHFKKPLAHLTGALTSEVVSMNNLTTNLHLLLASFYQPKGKRVKIMIEGGAFPSDHYAAESHMQRMGINPAEHLVVLRPKEGQVFETAEIVEAIHHLGNTLALVLFPGVQYFTGQLFDLKAITQAAHEVGAYAGFDLAHAIGNVPMNLHDDEVDFATWCSYKYLNSGPGGVSGIFVHENHCSDPQFPKLTGWWGHEAQTRFLMTNEFVPSAGVDAWMLSNINVVSSAVHLAALMVFEKTTIHDLRKKSIFLTGFLEFLLTTDEVTRDHLTVITPANPLERGCQLSLSFTSQGKNVFEQLTEAGFIVDWREPNVMRVSPTPLYNRFIDVWELHHQLKEILSK